MEALLPRIYADLKIDENLVLNVYNYGSRVYGTHKPTSDYDLFIVMDREDPPLEFYGDGYFYKYELHRGNNYDVVIFSLENFKTLLRVHMLCAIECVFLPPEFIPVHTMDLRPFFMEEAFSIPALRKAIGHESSYSFSLAKKCILKNDIYRGLKNLFHGIRYILFAMQILTTKQVTDYRVANNYYNEIMTYRDRTDWTWNDLKVRYGPIYKQLRHEFAETAYSLHHPVEGVFEYHITVEDPSYRWVPEDNPAYGRVAEDTNDIDRFINICRELRLKPIVIMLSSGEHAKQVMTSNFVMGTYPDNLTGISDLAKKLETAGFPTCRLKIEARVSSRGYAPRRKMSLHSGAEAKAKSKGVPLTSEQMVTWKSAYFELHFKVKTDDKERLFDLCKRRKALIAWNALKPEGSYLITIRLFSCGLPDALSANKDFKNYLRSNGYTILQNQKEFVVYDNNIDLDKGWQSG